MPYGKLFGVIDLSSGLTLHYVMLIIMVMAFLLTMCTVHSPFGRILEAIKKNELCVTSLGYDTDRLKLLAFVLSTVLAGLAGSLKTLILGFGMFTDVHWSVSGSVVLMTLVDDPGILSGPLLDTALIITLGNRLGDIGSFLAGAAGIDDLNILGESVIMVTGTVLVTCVLAFRRGIMGEITVHVPWLRH